jgi:hypothetical protein
MAKLVIEGQDLRLKLNPLELAGTFWPPPKATINQVVSVEFYDQPWIPELLQGFRAPGTGIPFVVMMGVMRRLKTKDFVVIKRRKPAVSITFSGGPFQRWIYTLDGTRHAEEELLAAIARNPSE